MGEFSRFAKLLMSRYTQLKREQLARDSIKPIVPSFLAAKKATSSYAMILAHALQAYKEEINAGKATAGAKTLDVLFTYLEPLQIAVSCLQYMFWGLDQPRTRVALAFSAHLKAECYAVILKKNGFDLRYMPKELKAAQDYLHASKMAAIAQGYTEAAEQMHLVHANLDKACVAVTDIAIETLPLFELVRRANGKNSAYFLSSSAQYDELVRIVRENPPLLHPRTAPMICEPEEWTRSQMGGFLLNKQQIMPWAPLSVLEEDLQAGRLDTLLSCANTLQKTRYKINGRILPILEELAQYGGDRANIVQTKVQEVQRPKRANYEGMTEAQRRREREKRRALFALIEKNNSKDRVSKTTKLLANLSFARKNIDETLYLVPRFDFRARIYYSASVCNPQHEDYVRALIQFKEAKPLGAGVESFLIYGANCFGNGIDKKDFAQRIAFIKSNHARILQVAAAPLKNDFWEQADEPWQFLAFCLEYSEGHKDLKNYKSSLPIYIDATCSALQHWAALTLNEQVASKVNLGYSQQPQDIYINVLESFKGLIAQSDLSPVYKELALKHVDRKVAKLPTLAKTYGMTNNSIALSIRENSPIIFQKLPAQEARMLQQRLGKMLKQAIATEIGSIEQALQAMRTIAKTLAMQKKHFELEMPDGFVMRQSYYKQHLVQARFQLKKTVKVRHFKYFEKSKEISIKDSVNSIAANLIHSFDALLLRKAVGEFSQVTPDISVIHDSFGVHACHVQELKSTLKKVFVEIYTEKHFGRILPLYLGDQAYGLVSFGKLKIDQVLHSQYFFN